MKNRSLEGLHLYWCELYSYTAGHSEMYVHASLREKSFYLFFPSVIYFEGSTSWKSADFDLRPVNECLSLLRALQRFDELGDNVIRDLFQLYQVVAPRTSIKVVSSGIEITDKLPSHLA